VRNGAFAAFPVMMPEAAVNKDDNTCRMNDKVWAAW
jgi:hypothetical protein